jgi:membrane protease YdiL (CAAX protease family)
VPATAAAFHHATGEWLPTAGRPVPVVRALPAPGVRRDVLAVLCWILLVADLVVVAFELISALYGGFILLFQPDSEVAQRLRDLASPSPMELYWTTLLQLVLFGVIPLVWALGTRVPALEGTGRFFHLTEPRRAILRGVLLTVPLLAAVAVFSVAYTVATEGIDAVTDPDHGDPAPIEEMLENLTWPLAVFLAFGAGFGEEVFFRGLLQKRLGVWGQALLFGLAHALGGFVPQILFATGLGLFFGYLLKRGWSLWSLITAHFLYDLVLLSVALLFPDFG